MNLEMWIVSAVLLFTLLCFITEWLRYDLAALLALFALAACRIIPLDEVFLGFSNPAVITVASLTVISDAFQRSGAVYPLAIWLGRISTSVAALATLSAVTVALLSAFMNNIAAITLILPIVIRVCRQNGWPPSKALIPLAFGSLVGGVTTLIGTPPNLLASSMLEQWDYRPLAFFELTPLALPVLGVAALYFMFVAHRLLPDQRQGADMSLGFGVTPFLVEAIVPPDGPLSNRLIRNTNLRRNFDATVLGIIRDGTHVTNPGGNHMLQPGDVLQIEVPRHNLVPLRQVTGLEPTGPKTLEYLLSGPEAELTDVVVTARSSLVGRTLREMRFRTRHRLQVLAIAHHGRGITERIGGVRLEGGDTLLVLGAPELVDVVADDLDLVLLDREPISMRKTRIAHVAALFGAMIALSIAGLVPISVAAIGTAALMVATGCLQIRQAYQAVPWSIIVLLGAMAGVATAVEHSGLTRLGVSGILSVVGNNPLLMLATLYILSCTLASLVTPPATILLIGPLVHGLAMGMSLNPRPFLIMVILGVSCAFLSPFGHQSNVLVFSAGNYRFMDYFKTGLPLCALIMGAALVLVPLLWSF